MRRPLHRLLLAIFIAVPCLAAAQSIYKVQTSDGSILFTDTPPAGSKILEERSTKSTPRPAAGAAGAPARSAAASAPRSTASAAASPQASALDAAIQEAAAAETAVKVAKRRLELGREPLPGERLGLAGGGSRLTPEYEARVAGLEREVAEAEARLKRANEAQSAAR